MKAHQSPEFKQWVAKAKAVRIEDELARRGIVLKRNGSAELKGPDPDPACGGRDRFSVNTHKGCFNCRGCGAKGDVISLVRHLDKVDFLTACEILTGEPPPFKANGKDRSAGAGSKLGTSPEIRFTHTVLCVQHAPRRSAAGRSGNSTIATIARSAPDRKGLDGAAGPVAICIDTLNRSFTGSESSDEDMTAYLKAADAVGRRSANCSFARRV
jgi:hypothetical protein